GVGERGGNAEHLLARGGVTVVAGVEQPQRAADEHHDRDHQDLQGDRLTGQRAGPPPAHAAPSSSAAMANTSSPAPTATKCAAAPSGSYISPRERSGHS